MSAENGSLLDVKQVSKRIHASERTVWSMVQKGTLPPPLKLGRKMRRWEPEIIEQYLRAKRAEATKEHKRRLELLSS